MTRTFESADGGRAVSKPSVDAVSSYSSRILVLYLAAKGVRRGQPAERMVTGLRGLVSSCGDGRRPQPSHVILTDRARVACLSDPQYRRAGAPLRHHLRRVGEHNRRQIPPVALEEG